MLNLCFKRSEQGRELWAAKSPFSQDQTLMLQFKSWACANVEHLTVQKCTEWVNEQLLKDWTLQLRAINIKALPVTELTVH
jgi:hypothetical protein